jgi:triosephosphate isomerase
MSERRPFVAGNWKMHKTGAEAKAFVEALASGISRANGVEVAVCPPFTALASTLHAVRELGVGVFAQNMHYETEGAFTGEVAPPMLTALGVTGAIVGHSERRAMFGETDRALALKVPAALEHGLVPILCVGETEEERDAGDTERKLRHQVQEDLARVDPDRLGEVVIAYEPIWAIGTGRVATPDQAQEALGFIRALVGDRSTEAAQRIRLLYGGSVNADNAAQLLALPDCDGALVGGASLKPDSLAAIVAAAP